MKLLEHESLESRIKLINHTETISQLKVDPSTLTKFSSTEVLAHCVVCSSLFKRQMKSINVTGDFQVILCGRKNIYEPP